MRGLLSSTQYHLSLWSDHLLFEQSCHWRTPVGAGRCHCAKTVALLPGCSCWTLFFHVEWSFEKTQEIPSLPQFWRSVCSALLQLSYCILIHIMEWVDLTDPHFVVTWTMARSWAVPLVVELFVFSVSVWALGLYGTYGPSTQQEDRCVMALKTTCFDNEEDTCLWW